MARSDADEFFDNYLNFALPPGVERQYPLDPSSADDWDAWWRAIQERAVDTAERVAAAQGFVLAPAQAGAAGVTRARQRTEVRRGRWSVRRRGVLSVVAPNTADHDGRRRNHALDVAAAALSYGNHVVSGRSAAILHGLPTLDIPLAPELTTSPDQGVGLRNGVRCRDAATNPDEVTRWFGVPVHSVPRTVVDLARHSRRDGLMAADAALHRRLASPVELARALQRIAGWPGARQAREVIALADPRAESALESVTRLALHDSGFPPPDLQVVIAGYRVDFYWAEQRFVLEADGALKYRPRPGNADPIWTEKRREAALRRAECRIDRVVWSDVMGQWPTTSRRLAGQLGIRLPR